MIRVIIIILLLNSVCYGQRIFGNGWRNNEGNPPGSSANLDIQGFGKNASGADPGDPTITVTNTNTSGAGSLSNAIFNAIGGTGSTNSHKRILFSISGAGPHVIASDFTITNLSYVTFDGSGETIVIDSPNSCSGSPCNDGFSFENTGAHHIIVKNLHFRDCQDGLNVVDGAHDIAIVNCAFWLNHDGNVDIASDAHNVTIQYSVIGNHVNECHCGSGGAGGILITGYDNSVHHNLCNPGSTSNPDEGERFPLVHGNYSDAFADFRNNIVYKYGRNNATGSGFGSAVGYNGAGSGCGCYGRANFVNNYYYTPSTAADQDGVSMGGSVGIPDGSGYSAGNVSGNGFNFNTGSYTNHAEWDVSIFAIDVETACEAVDNVLAHVGPDTKHSDVQAFIDDVTQLGSCACNTPKLLPFKTYDYGVSFNSNDGNNTVCISQNESVGLVSRRFRYQSKVKIKV